jgi:hypothetical protein
MTCKSAFLTCGAVSAFLGAAAYASAQNLNGTVSPSFYGAPLAIQTINTGFGPNNAADSGTGSELDAAYGAISGGNLYLFLAGNVQNNGNHLNVFIAGGAAGQNTLNAPAGSNLASMNGSVFSPGFNATFGFDVNDFSGTQYGEEDYLTGTPTGSYVGAIPSTSTGIYAGTFPTGVTSLYANNNHVSTMGAPGTALSGATSGANTTTGYELVIPLSAIGYTGGNIMVLADINGAGSPPNTYLSNQFLPGLPVGSQNVGGGTTPFSAGGGTFNFGNTPGEYFTIVPEPSSMVLLGLSGLTTLLAIRRRK